MTEKNASNQSGGTLDSATRAAIHDMMAERDAGTLVYESAEAVASRYNPEGCADFGPCDRWDKLCEWPGKHSE